MLISALFSCDNIKKFVVHTSNPDIAKLYSFNCKLGNTTLYVPKGSKEAFAQHEAWNRFGAIVEYDDVNGIGRLESGQQQIIIAVVGICRGLVVFFRQHLQTRHRHFGTVLADGVYGREFLWIAVGFAT